MVHRLNVAGADERLTIANVDVAENRLATMASLKALVLSEGMVPTQCRQGAPDLKLRRPLSDFGQDFVKGRLAAEIERA